jgi:hypothetical protein
MESSLVPLDGCARRRPPRPNCRLDARAAAPASPARPRPRPRPHPTHAPSRPTPLLATPQPPGYYNGGARSHLVRYVFDLGARSLVSSTRLMTRTCEFPSVNPAAHARGHRHVYCCADIVDDPECWGPAQVGLWSEGGPPSSLRAALAW